MPGKPRMSPAEAERARHEYSRRGSAKWRARNPAHAEKIRAWQAANVARVKLYRHLEEALRSGRAARPDRCSRCPRGAATGYRIAGYFPPGVSDVARVVWLCRPCLWAERHPEEVARYASARLDVELEAHRMKLAAVRALLRSRTRSPERLLRTLAPDRYASAS